MKQLSLESLYRQRGVSKFGLLMLLFLIASFFTIGMKVGPLYIDHNLITGICRELIENGQADDMSVTDVRNQVSNSLRINNIRDFDLSDIRMRKQDGKAVITIAYERRVEFIANLDLVASFDTTLQ
jgi:hypothetical protein